VIYIGCAVIVQMWHSILTGKSARTTKAV
jgi:hypothetical protein